MEIPRQRRTSLRKRCESIRHGAARLSGRLAGAVALLVLSACTTLMTPPQPPDVKVRVAGISYEEGLVYLDSARTNMRAGLDSVDQLDRATRLGVGVGVAGAGVAAAFRGPADAVLGFLTLGGLSYALSQNSVPTVQAGIYTAGLKNLMCIEQTASRVYEDTAFARSELAVQLPRLQRARDRVKTIADKARTQSDNTLKTLLPEADTAVQASEALIVAVQRFLGASNIGNEIYAGVNMTVEEVNRQLRKQAPDIDAIAQSGTIVRNFVSSQSQQALQSAAANAAQAATPKAASQALQRDPLVADLTDALAELNSAIAAIRASLPTKSEGRRGEAISSCQTVAPGDGPVTVEPSGPIKLTAGGDAFNVRVSGNKSLSPRWKGLVPSATQLVVSKPSDDLISLAAPAGAKPGTYVLYIHQEAPAKDSPDIEIIVGTPVANGATRQGGPLASRGAPIPVAPPPIGAKFAADRRLLGLGPAVTATSDPLWMGRVNKLDNCLGISPSTGQITAALRTQLAKHAPVNSAGDCPAPLPAVVAPTPIPAPPQNPIPAPPTPQPNR